MRSLWQGKSHPWNTASLLKFDTFYSFYARNIESVGQRAAKLPAIELLEWFDPVTSWTRAEWFEWGRGCPADFSLRPPTLKASNFKALRCTDPIFLAWKGLICFPKYTKIQESGSIFMVGFALSKSPHWHMTYLVTLSKCPWLYILHNVPHWRAWNTPASKVASPIQTIPGQIGLFTYLVDSTNFNIGYPAKSEAHSITLQRSVWCFFNLIQISLNALCRGR